MTETIVIQRHKISSQDLVDTFVGRVSCDAVVVWLISPSGERREMTGMSIEIDVLNPGAPVDRTAGEAAAGETNAIGDERNEEDPNPEDLVDSPPVDEEETGEDRPEEDEETSAEGKRFFYNSDADKLLVTTDGSIPAVVDDVDTAADWTELDAAEGEVVEAELAKQGDLLGGAPQPAEKDAEKKATNAQQAGILCGEKAFQKWLDVDNDEHAAITMRGMLKVESRKDLDTDPAAGKRFREMRGNYEAWLRSGAD